MASEDLAQVLGEQRSVFDSGLEPIEHLADGAMIVGEVGEQRGVRL